jgi:tetratricopeptide (TPR) repeat protein
MCSDEDLASVVRETDEAIRLAEVERLTERHPDDARLHFLRGSLLIGRSRLVEAHAALSHAVALAPEFYIARFQLGFFQLTSGEAEEALATWLPLDALPAGHYLGLFVNGLRALVRDDFSGAVALLREGIAENEENLPLNGDMQLLIDQCLPLIPEHGAVEANDAPSETSLVLSRFAKPRRAD